jgi:hypothetical protein
VCEFERWTTRRLDAGAKLCVFLEYIIGCVCVSTHQRVGIVARTLAFFSFARVCFFFLCFVLSHVYRNSVVVVLICLALLAAFNIGWAGRGGGIFF